MPPPADGSPVDGAREARAARRALAAALVGVALLGACQTSTAEDAVGASEVRARPLVLPAQPVRFGQLELRTALVLTSGDPGFGGLSGLWIAPGGERLIAASDGGTLWLAALGHAGDGTLIDASAWRPVAPGHAAGDPVGGKQDAEALAQLDGDLVIAYEGVHRLRRVPLAAPSASATVLPTPAELGEPHNRGMEALVELEDGALLALSEGVRDPAGDLMAWRIGAAGTARLSYVTTGGFVPTGAARLDGTIYVVERRFSLFGGFGTRIMTVAAAAVVPGARLIGRELGTVQSAQINDNFEGIAARPGPDGRVLLYLVSDDNFTPLLRTVLLQLSLGSPDRLSERVARSHQGAERQQQ